MSDSPEVKTFRIPPVVRISSEAMLALDHVTMGWLRQSKVSVTFRKREPANGDV